MAIRRWASFAALVVGLASAGCSSSRGGPAHPAFPTNPDPCSAYCLVYVPPVYRDVQRVVACREPGVKCVTVPGKKIVFEEHVKPGCYTEKRTPCRCREEVVVEATPGYERWEQVECCGECCYRNVKVPPTYKLCEKTVTEGGVAYCAFTPPEYHIVAKTVATCEQKEIFRPGEYRVVTDQELFQDGRYEWRRRDDCKFGPAYCSPPAQPAPSTSRPGFGRAPSAD